MSKTPEEIAATAGRRPTRRELAEAMKRAHARGDLGLLARLRAIYDKTK